MSSLKDALAKQNEWTPPIIQCVENNYTSVPMLALHPWQEGIWLFPWARLDFMRHVDEDAVERVEFSFSHHRVVAVGENLRQILKECRNSEVHCLRSMPAAHRANLKPTAPFISQLEVKLLADLRNEPAGELPF